MPRLKQLPERAVFICALECAGAEMFGSLFDSHPQTLYLRGVERMLTLPARPRLAKELPASRAQDVQAQTANYYLRRALTRRSVTLLSERPLFAKRYLSALSCARLRLLVGCARVAKKLCVPEVTDIILDVTLSGEERVVWSSINATVEIDAVASQLAPHSTFLLINDPCRYVENVLHACSTGSLPGIQFLSEDYPLFVKLVADPYLATFAPTVEQLRALTPIERVGWRWALINSKAICDVQRVPQGMVVRFEDVFRALRSATRTLFAHAALDWNEQTANYVSDMCAQSSVECSRYLSARARARVAAIADCTPAGDAYSQTTVATTVHAIDDFASGVHGTLELAVA